VAAVVLHTTALHRASIPASCTEGLGATTFYLGEPSTLDLVRKSPLIVYGKAVGHGYLTPGGVPSPDATPEIAVERVLKGRGTRQGEVIRLCRHEGLPVMSPSVPNYVVAFFVARDGADWVPQDGGLGVVRADQAGHFDLGRVAQDGGVFELEDIAALVDEAVNQR